MKRELALQLLDKLLPNPPWDEEKVRELLAQLQTLAEYKYNSYEMYQPGRLFLENLYLWLSHFTAEERDAALKFVTKQLIFISREEFEQLVHILFNDRIRQAQLDLASKQSGIARHRVRELDASSTFKSIQRASLYVAMSDGARIDYFRRQNLEINNEQVVAAYYASKEKYEDTLRELRKNTTPDNRFQCLFLVDDFCGSGRTLLREVIKQSVSGLPSNFEVPDELKAHLTYSQEKKELELAFRGPIPEDAEKAFLAVSKRAGYKKAIRSIISKAKRGDTTLKGSLARIAANGDLLPTLAAGVKPFLCPLLSTQYAKSRLERLIPRLQGQLRHLKIMPGAVVDEGVRIKPSDPIGELCEKYYDPATLEDEHTGSVKYGYDNCALPLVLHHNTPNNSIYLLWARKLEHPLFVRYERHGRGVM